MASKQSLLDDMDDAARELLKSVNPHTIDVSEPGAETQPIDLKGRVLVFAAVTDYLAVKHKIQPSGAKKNGLDRYRAAIDGGETGRGARGKRPAPSALGSDNAAAADGE